MDHAREDSGVGLPYAPENWPEAGDIWSWKVGTRARNGYYRDRYLCLPQRLRKLQKQTSRKYIFRSKLEVETYVRTVFPNADVQAFFDSFTWRVPVKGWPLSGNESGLDFPSPSEEDDADALSDVMRCKAGNKMCGSLVEKTDDSPLVAQPCDLCCGDSRFCRDCCCVICYKIVSSNDGGSSYIRCEAIVEEGYICGHCVHVECALQMYVAGTVGGKINLDAEYHCELCDVRKDLIPHVKMLIENCKSIDSSEQVEKTLNLGRRILSGTQKNEALKLLRQIESAIKELKRGTALEEMWKAVENMSVTTSGICDNGDFLKNVENDEPPLKKIRLQNSFIVFPDYQSESCKLENETHRVLQELRKSQESEYGIAVECLHAQKDYIKLLYQQLDQERSGLARQQANANTNGASSVVAKRMEQIRKEEMKLQEMKAVINGFGATSARILAEHFGMSIDI